MQCNVGQKDRTIRFAAGGLIILLGLLAHSWWGAVGLLPILTAAVRICPAYTLFGINTGK